MIRVFCDSCGEETTEIHKTIDLPHHIVTKDIAGYIHTSGQNVSGKMITFQLCLKCYNRVMEAAYEQLTRQSMT